MNLPELLIYAGLGSLLGFSVLYLYWRFCFVKCTKVNYSGPRSFWRDLFGKGGYPNE